MAKKKAADARSFDGREAPIVNQPITETIEKNYMPYVVTVMVSRAIPEIDGFKPSHRKLLYTMYKMGLMTGPKTKSANVVGQTMKLNPHGGEAIYETLVRLTRGNESLLHPFIDSKGSFGKHYSNGAFAAQRYTEVKLDGFCNEIFKGINADAVDFIDNYDNTEKEPVLLPTSFPNVLVMPNMGIAVGMASKICSFSLSEVCDGTVQLLRDEKTDTEQLLDIIKAPDFPGGGALIYNRDQLREIYNTGRGSIRLRSRYTFDKAENCIEITEIPYSTTVEQILKKLTECVKLGKVKEIVDCRDETDKSGLKIVIDVRRGTDPDKLMTKLFKMTPLEDSFDCNFNILIGGSPVQLGVISILNEWIKFRVECVRRESRFDMERKQEKLHLLLGLGKILLDIDKAIKIIRETENEVDVIANLMDGFNIDKIQAEYVAEIKLRNLNKEYIINRIKEIESLQKAVSELSEFVVSDRKIKAHIASQLREIKQKYGIPRKTMLVYDSDIEVYREESTVENFSVRALITKDGYFKKITLLSLRGNDEQKLKDGDAVASFEDAWNISELLAFSDRCQVYKSKLSEFDTLKASVLGDFLPAKLGFDEGERVIYAKTLSEYADGKNMIFIFENGKGVRIPISAYQTKANRKKLTGAYSDASPIVFAAYEDEPFDLMLITNGGRAVIINTSLIPIKTTRSSAGVALIKLKAKQTVTEVTAALDTKTDNPKPYKKIKIPASGVLLEKFNIEKKQISFDEIK